MGDKPSDGLPEPSGELGGGEPAGSDEPTAEDRIAELEASNAKFQQDLEAAQQREAEQNARLEESNRNFQTLLRATPGASTYAPPKADGIGDPPDPVAEPEQFKEWTNKLAKHSETVAHQTEERVREENRQQRRLDNLWNEFKAEYPQYAEAHTIVEAAFLEETNGTGEIPSDGDGFKKRLAQRLDSMVSKLGKGGEETPPGQPAKKAGRTEGLSGGSAAPPKPKRKGGGDDDNRSFTDQLKDIQSQSDFF